VEERVEVGAAMELTLKGFHEPVEVFRVTAHQEDAPHGSQ
jgi:class 3 adenylate cyclase